VNWAVLAAAKRREICVPTSAEPPFSRPDRGELCSHMRKGLFQPRRAVGAGRALFASNSQVIWRIPD